MVAFNFKKQFAGDVESGKKLQTIRRKMRVKAGDKIQLYTGMRTRGCRKLRDAICVAVDNISITPDGPFFGQPGWWPKDKNLFAERDGFSGYATMYEWFFNIYGEEIFNGYVIMWRSARSCRKCGCVDEDCSGCIEKTGQPCHWVEADLCSACRV